ncbi:hypothetical protein H2204_005981 [Knufia peltigerae]|uniref:NAD(P)-binding protein n=1 Tax=Knufia peltigerae TaxID=1002370 RepID=A0AA38Y4J1_9EURO|nr:hypothetical protein H2204_005981 [Knufia peltigerae]
MATYQEFNKFTNASEVAAKFPKQIANKTILITGVSPNGLGQSTAEALAAHEPARLILAGRTQSKVQAVIDHISSAYPAVDCRYLELDLSSLTSVKNAALQINSSKDIPEVDIVICNAGVMWIQDHQQSPDNIEMQFATNHVGHFLFVNLILPKLIAAASHSPAGAVRVINLSSDGHRFSPVRFSDANFTKEQKKLPENERANLAVMGAYGLGTDGIYNPVVAYGQSKTANVLFSLELSNRLFKRYGIKSYALHPGGINTELWRHTEDAFVQALVEAQKAAGVEFKTLEQGSSTTLVAALDPHLPAPTPEGDNLYLNDCQFYPAEAWARTAENAERLWALSESLVGQEFSV